MNTQHTPGPHVDQYPIELMRGMAAEQRAKLHPYNAARLDQAADMLASAPSLVEALQQALFAIPTDHGAFQVVRDALKLASPVD